MVCPFKQTACSLILETQKVCLSSSHIKDKFEKKLKMTQFKSEPIRAVVVMQRYRSSAYSCVNEFVKVLLEPCNYSSKDQTFLL